MTDYIAPDPAISEWIHRSEAESKEHYRRLEHSPLDHLKQVVRDRKEPIAARGNALMLLLQHHRHEPDHELADILLELLDDADGDMLALALQVAPKQDPRIVDKLRSLLDDPRAGVWSQAAAKLARAHDQTILPRMREWFRSGDRGRRNVAIEALTQLGHPQALCVLQEAWDQGGIDEEDRLVIGVALLRSGDERAMALLRSVAQRADSEWSVFAATSIWRRHSAEGLQLMRWILDHGTLRAQQCMLNQIWNLTHLPHAFTADGIHEARLWIDQQLQSLQES